MATGETQHGPNGAGVGDLVRDLADGSAALVRQEVVLARVEFETLATAIAEASAAMAAGGVCLLLGGLAVVAGVIVLIAGPWLAGQYWVMGMVAFVIAGAVAAWFARRGLVLLSPARLIPKDATWLRPPPTSGAKSR